MENEVLITVKGKISDFARIDNIYSSIKRESEKMLKDWHIEITATYTEQQTEES